MLLHHEGGFVNHPSDPGGMTNLGVTKSTWDHFYGDDISEERMRDITVDDIKPIYRTNYWDRCRCGDLPSGVDWAVFDWALNSGPGKAAKALQRAVGAYEDGAVGPQTLMAVTASQPAARTRDASPTSSPGPAFRNVWVRCRWRTSKRACPLRIKRI